MRAARIAFIAVGALLAAWGVDELLPLVQWQRTWLVSTGSWLFAGPVIHDLLVAPIVAFSGLMITRVVPQPWRTAVAIALASTGVLLLIAIPLLWRPHAAGHNPGLQDRNYTPGLLVFIATIWTTALLLTLLTTLTRNHRKPSGSRSRQVIKDPPGMS